MTKICIISMFFPAIPFMFVCAKLKLLVATTLVAKIRSCFYQPTLMIPKKRFGEVFSATHPPRGLWSSLATFALVNTVSNLSLVGLPGAVRMTLLQ